MHSGEKPINMTRVLDTVMTGKTLLDLRKLASMSEEELAAADLASELAPFDPAYEGPKQASESGWRGTYLISKIVAGGVGSCVDGVGNEVSRKRDDPFFYEH